MCGKWNGEPNQYEKNLLRTLYSLFNTIKQYYKYAAMIHLRLVQIIIVIIFFIVLFSGGFLRYMINISDFYGYLNGARTKVRMKTKV